MRGKRVPALQSVTSFSSVATGVSPRRCRSRPSVILHSGFRGHAAARLAKARVWQPSRTNAFSAQRSLTFANKLGLGFGLLTNQDKEV